MSEIASDDFKLPVLPEIALKILTLNEDTFDQVLRIVRRDKSLTAHILKVANSAMFPSNRRVETIDQATVRLGFSNIRQIALSVICRDSVFRVPGFEKDVREMFEHSIRAAVCASEIAKLRGADPETGFVMGLLHDIGRPIVLSRICSIAEQTNVKLRSGAPWPAVNALHAEVGARLAHAWNFSERMEYAIKNHHALPDQVTDDPWISMVQLADVMARVDPSERTSSLSNLRCNVSELNHLVARADSIETAVNCLT